MAEKDYKETLNLPTTPFPMKANLASREPECLKRWEDAHLYSSLLEEWKTQGRGQFILHDGPPYANGHLHVGHAVNKVAKDIVIKSKILSGYAAPYIPGWDCHGLPIELNVEKKVGRAGHKVSYSEFRQACREYAKRFIDIQREEFKRLGVLGDWDNPYITMDFKYEANIIRALGKVFEKGYVSQGHKPVFWCFDCASALAQAEVEYKDKASPAIDVRFTVVDRQTLVDAFSLNEPINIACSIPIWTTTPWTLPANEAVALHAELEYALVRLTINDETEAVVVAKTLVDDVANRYKADDVNILAVCLGNRLNTVVLQHPFYDKQVPIVFGEHVTIEAGTGAVHTAPAHGPDDFQLAKAFDLPVKNPVAGNGCFIDGTPLFAKQHVFKANEAVVTTLKENNKLLALEEISHSYPHCWRHKSPLIFRTTPQWFINMDKSGLRKSALQAIKTVEWVPGKGQARIESMVENNPDWCISRQRSWGTPIPVFIHKQTGVPHPDTPALMFKVADIVAEKGIDGWYDCDATDLLGDAASDYDKGHDVLDVWFDSGVTHYCVLSEGSYGLTYPADLYLEGSDQHRGWFQSSLLTSVAIHNRAPYRAVLTHGFTVDGEGRKMSKSIGNIVTIDAAVKKWGADILRLWIASTDYHNEIAVSDEILKRTSDVYRRIRNTARFLLSNINDFDENACVAQDELLSLDYWIVHRTRELQHDIARCYQGYRFHQVYQKIHYFCSIELGSFYLDVIKDRQYTTQTNSLARRSAQTAMYHIIHALVRWIAPILSFTAEEIWQHVPGKIDESIFQTTWYEPIDEFEKERAQSSQFWQKVMRVRDAVNKLLETMRAENKLGSGLTADVTLYCDKSLFKDLSTLEDELRFALITSSAAILPLTDAPDKAVETDVDGLSLLIEASPHNKCVRCWHQVSDVGSDAKHPELCHRCIANVEGTGEVRKFV